MKTAELAAPPPRALQSAPGPAAAAEPVPASTAEAPVEPAPAAPSADDRGETDVALASWKPPASSAAKRIAILAIVGAAILAILYVVRLVISR